MSFYNAIFGQNPLSSVLLASVGLTKNSVGRFRDAFLEREESGRLLVCVYTRNGGSNRECWETGDGSMQCGCVGCIATFKLPDHPGYVDDTDDEYDCTYATFRFEVPENLRGLFSELGTQPESMSDRWRSLIEALKTASTEEDIATALKAVPS